MSKHIIVIGPGRCGTSAFVRFLHNLGLDTGFTDEQVNRDWGRRKSGLEWVIRGLSAKPPFPYVIKSPALSENLPERIMRWGWEIEHAYILVRKPEDIVRSRFEATRGTANVSDEDFEDQMEKAYRKAGRALLDCVGLGIPYSIIEYPLWAKDQGYCFDILRPLFRSYNHFKEAHEKTVDPSKLR